MNWTSKKPTEVGYYWYKPCGDEAQKAGLVIPGNWPIMVHYITSPSKKIVCLLPHMDECYPTAPDQMNGLWYGPIAPPV